MDTAQILLAIGVAVLGLLIGSFLNVVIWRVPRAESIVSPPSACPSCGHPLRARDNIPVLSWLLLRGRCRDCGDPISKRYPLVELTTAVLFAVMSIGIPVEALPAYLWLTAAGVALSVIDIDHKRLPNAIVYPTAVVVGVWLVGTSLVTGEPELAVRTVLAGLALFAFYLLLALVYPAGLGLVYAKPRLVLGFGLGWLSCRQWLSGLFWRSDWVRWWELSLSPRGEVAARLRSRLARSCWAVRCSRSLWRSRSVPGIYPCCDVQDQCQRQISVGSASG